MPGSGDPPEPSIREDVKSYFEDCTWNANLGRVEYQGAPVTGWLGQTATGVTASVEWAVDTSSGSCITCKIPKETYDIISGGVRNQTTGVITYENKNYRFRHAVVNDEALMKAVEV
jgi:hypothetical protein